MGHFTFISSPESKQPGFRRRRLTSLANAPTPARLGLDFCTTGRSCAMVRVHGEVWPSQYELDGLW